MRLISLALAASMLHTTFAFDRQALSSWFTGLNPDKVVHAINCGSTEEIVDLLGVTYSAVTPLIPLLTLLGFRLHRRSIQRGWLRDSVGTP